MLYLCSQSIKTSKQGTPKGDSLLVSDGGGGGQKFFWVCETLFSIPLGTLLSA